MKQQKTISFELLKKAGYTKYSKFNDFTNFQKKIKDKEGIKYFIHCKYYTVLNNQENLEFWDFSMQLETRYEAVNFNTVQWFNQSGKYSRKTIKDVEDYFEWLWQQHNKPYYEKVNN